MPHSGGLLFSLFYRTEAIIQQKPLLNPYSPPAAHCLPERFSTGTLESFILSCFCFPEEEGGVGGRGRAKGRRRSSSLASCLLYSRRRLKLQHENVKAEFTQFCLSTGCLSLGLSLTGLCQYLCDVQAGPCARQGTRGEDSFMHSAKQ